jgi:transcriptional regulator GlxA family with amidase domain
MASRYQLSREQANILMSIKDSFESCPVLDIVLIGAYFPAYNPTAADLIFIRKAYEQSTAFLSICGGVFPSVLAGVLKGKTCTGPRDFLPQLKGMDPSINWVEKRMHRDGKVWTSGALLNGLDLIREFVKEFWPELAQALIPVGGIPERSVEY